MSEACYTGLLGGERAFPLTVVALRLLAGGESVTLARLADAAGWPMAEVEQVLRGFPGVDWDEQDRLAGLGLTTRRTPHRFRINGHDLYTWCAIDTLLFPVVLDRPAEARSTCPTSGREIVVSVAPDGLRAVEPAGAVVTEVRSCCPVDDVRATICDHGHFFASRDDAAQWSNEHPDGVVSGVAEAFESVRRWAAESRARRELPR